MNILKENSNAIKQWLDTIYPDILVAKYILLHEINKKNGLSIHTKSSTGPELTMNNHLHFLFVFCPLKLLFI